MDELKERGQPRQTELIAAQKELIKGQDELIKLALRSNAEQVITNNLLSSINYYHGNPDSHKGFLEDLYITTKCEKKKTQQHRNTGLIVAMLITVVALVGESISKGESSVFIIGLKLAKEFMI